MLLRNRVRSSRAVEITLVTATRGERGWNGDEADFPGLQELEKLREAELRCAAEKLGIRRVSFLDYLDGELDQADPVEAVAKIRAIRTYYRAYNLVNGRRRIETDLFEGLW